MLSLRIKVPGLQDGAGIGTKISVSEAQIPF